MQIVNAENVMVVVSRWYGGIHLGPDRFKHINNCTRTILEKHGYLTQRVRVWLNVCMCVCEGVGGLGVGGGGCMHACLYVCVYV